jgi:hypothetical protein
MMIERQETAPQEPTHKGECCHYWIIEPADGPTSKGICQFCGAEKEFDSFGPDSLSRWDRSIDKSGEVPVAPDVAPAGDQDDS